MEVPNTTNRELFASKGGNARERLLAAEPENEELGSMMDTIENGLKKYEKGTYLLTDDKAPVELLGMSVIDELIQKEVGYYREVFEEEGNGFVGG